MSIKQIIEAIELGDASSVTTLFDKLMASKLEECIEEKKQELSESLFEEESVEESVDELDEDFEALDELSKSTLGAYVKKANRDTAVAANSKGFHTALSMNHGSSDSNKAEQKGYAADSNKVMNKRVKGVGKAVARLTKEETEDLSLEDFTIEELEDFMQTEDFEALDEVSGKLLGSYIQKARADQRKKYDNENALDNHPKVAAIKDKRRELYNRKEYTRSGESKHANQINALRQKEPEVKKKLDANYPKSGTQGANKRGRGIEKAIKKLTSGKLSD